MRQDGERPESESGRIPLVSGNLQCVFAGLEGGRDRTALSRWLNLIKLRGCTDRVSGGVLAKE